MEREFIPDTDFTINSGASVTAPNGSIVSIGAPAPGDYRVVVSLCLTGTAETALANLKVLLGSNNNTSVVPTITGSGWLTLEFYAYIPSGNISVNTVAAATAGAVYSVSMQATRLASRV